MDKGITVNSWRSSLELHDLETAFKAHEAQCEERWKTTFNRLDDIDGHLQKIESRVMAASGTIILFLLGLVAAHVSA